MNSDTKCRKRGGLAWLGSLKITGNDNIR